MDNRAVLAKTPFFANVLDEENLDRLAAAARRTDLDQGQTLIREHDPGDSVFVIVRGSLAITIHEGGFDRRVATLHDGEIVGEMSLLTGAARSATVTAIRPTVVLEITKSALQPLLDDNPTLTGRFAEMVELRQSELEELHGASSWVIPGMPITDLAERIRDFFSGGR